MYVHTISLYEETVRTSYKQKLMKKWYIHTYHFFVRRNGAYVPFLCTKKWCVHTVSSYKEMVRICTVRRNGTYMYRSKKRYVYVPFEETICTTNGMYLVQRKAYEEMVRMYIPFLCMKKRCVRTISLYEEMIRTVSSYKETVCTCRFFVRNVSLYFNVSDKSHPL